MLCAPPTCSSSTFSCNCNMARARFCINDDMDVLIEILKRLDERSIGVAACVCRLWCGLTRNEALWEHLCFGQIPPPTPRLQRLRMVVVALGGYRKLYTLCVKPVLARLGKSEKRVWSRQEVELALSLFSVDYYERTLLGGGGGGRLAGDSGSPPSSLMLLCKALNVS